LSVWRATIIELISLRFLKLDADLERWIISACSRIADQTLPVLQWTSAMMGCTVQCGGARLIHSVHQMLSSLADPRICGETLLSSLHI